jgi:hypothetical protein
LPRIVDQRAYDQPSDPGGSVRRNDVQALIEPQS